MSFNQRLEMLQAANLVAGTIYSDFLRVTCRLHQPINGGPEMQAVGDGGAELQAGDDDGAAIIDEEGAASDGVHEDFSCWNRRGFVLQAPWIDFFRARVGCVRAASSGELGVCSGASDSVACGRLRWGRRRCSLLSLRCAAVQYFQEEDEEDGRSKEAHPMASSQCIA